MVSRGIATMTKKKMNAVIATGAGAVGQTWENRVKQFLKQRDSIPWHKTLREKLFKYICGWAFQKNFNK